MKLSRYVVSFLFVLFTSPTLAVEYPIGKPQFCGGMEIAAVYLQPIEMEPADIMHPPAQSDIHLEADIHATEDNTNGFQEGSWIPYLQITYELIKQGSNETLKGMLYPMVANDGPHYGDNIKMLGVGKYQLKFIVHPPSEKSVFGRHVDKETGVESWFRQCNSKYDFVYAGTGKKGGY
ncbi:MAG: hypothetical protein JSC188_000022 [Candidatus Tokpelaia sp. JSC188]|nr:MAG: hypothetical protein JSC188_000022 [Candidatus Tokpelaia sp. JSC188]